MFKKLIILLIVLSGAYASTAAAFLDNGIASRSEAMGRAYTALADDLDAFYYNPAGYAWQSKTRINSMGTRMNNIYDVFYLGAGAPLGLGYGAVNLFMTSLGDIPETGYDGTYVTDSGNSFEYASRALFFSYGLNASVLFPGLEKLKFGASFKYIMESLYENKSSGSGIDFGLIYTVNNNLNIGFSVLNLLEPKMKWNTESGQTDTVQRKEKIGFGYKMNENLTLAMDITLQKYNNLVGLGAEYAFNPSFALRAGTFTNNNMFGLGFNYANFNIDYAFIQPSETLIGNTHKISIGYVFGAGEAKQAELKPVPAEKENIYQLPTLTVKEKPAIVTAEVKSEPVPEAKPTADQTPVVQLTEVSLIKKTILLEQGKIKAYYKLNNSSQNSAALKYTIIVIDANNKVLTENKASLILNPQSEDLLTNVTLAEGNAPYKVKAFITINEQQNLSFVDIAQ